MTISNHFLEAYSVIYLYRNYKNSLSSSNDCCVGSSSRSKILPDGMDPAEHPIENGVLHSYWGPISGGALLSGKNSTL